MAPIYPTSSVDRDRWILQQRPARNVVDPARPHLFFVESERSASGEVVPVATIFLTNRECPWRCLMCDLWKNTLEETVPVGAIPGQIAAALSELTRAVEKPRQIKLYNSGSFFDPRAVPVADYPAIVEQVQGFDRVIVECHPALVGDSCARFNDAIGGKLEVALGLETVHPAVLEKLNKRMTLESFQRAAEFLRQHEISLRVFVLVKPPFMDETAALEWACKSVDWAFACGASVVSLIPTRPGNGALDALAQQGDFTPPRLETLEASLDYGIGLKRGRVFADTWELKRFSSCNNCFDARKHRLEQINLNQQWIPRVECGCPSPGI